MQFFLSNIHPFHPICVNFTTLLHVSLCFAFKSSLCLKPISTQRIGTFQTNMQPHFINLYPHCFEKACVNVNMNTYKYDTGKMASCCTTVCSFPMVWTGPASSRFFCLVSWVQTSALTLDHFGILCDGTVVPCCLDSDGIINLGNAFEEELADILASPRARAIPEGFRRRKAVEDLCRRCGFAQKF